jgi:hypothetical protein
MARQSAIVCGGANKMLLVAEFQFSGYAFGLCYLLYQELDIFPRIVIDFGQVRLVYLVRLIAVFLFCF